MTTGPHSEEKIMFKFDDNDRPAECLTATLHALILGAPDPKVMADFYERAMGYRIALRGDDAVASAAGRHLVFAQGAPNTMIEAAFLLPNAGELARLRARIGAHGWPREDGPSVFFEDSVAVRDPDGNRLSFGTLALIPGENRPDQEVTEFSLDARLQHVVMASRDAERIVRFFVDVLGFTVSDDVHDGEGSVTTSFLRCSVEHHSFAVFRAGENRFDHHCYETRDWNAMRDWADHLAQERIRLQWGPGRHGPGNNLFLFFHDPVGNWVELSAELELVGHDRPVGAWMHEERTLNSWGPGKLRS